MTDEAGHRPSGRCRARTGFVLLSLHGQATFCEDCPALVHYEDFTVSRRRHVTARRLDDITARLDDLDWQVLRSIDLLRMVTGTQIQRLHHGGDEAARKRRIRQMSRLTRMGLTIRLERRIGGPEAGSYPSIYTLDRAALRLLDPERSRARAPWTPSTPFLAHHLAVAEVYVSVSEIARRGEVEILGFTTEPGCWRTWRTPLGIVTNLKPDAHLVLGLGDDEAHWFVEVDRSTESLPRVTAKCRTYAAYWKTGIEEAATGVFPLVLWVTPNDRRLSQVMKAIRRLDREDWPLFAATTDEHSAALLSGQEPGVTP